MTDRSDDDRLLELADAVAEGFNVDWANAEASTADATQRRVVAGLRELSRIASLNRPGTALPQWGPLELREELGRGVFGTVYRAWDPKLDREVALKLLHRMASDTSHIASAMIEEGRLLARVRHPNVVTIYGADRFDGRVGLWMELIRGKTLKQSLQERGALGAREAALIGIDLCRALAAVHKAGLIHRDVKAQNVMQEEGGRLVLMDFGAGREALPTDGRGSLAMTGTPLYMAPEILDGSPASPQSDLYSVGVLLFHLVTNSFPVSGSTVDELRRSHQRRRPGQLRSLRPDLPSLFMRVIEQATAFAAAERFQNAGAMEAGLEHSFEAKGIDRRRLLLGGTAATGLIALAAVRAVWRPSPGVASRPIRSVAVLPLVNLSKDKEQDYFVDGMTDGLINTLGRVSALKVTARTSVMPLKGTKLSIAEIARALGVDSVVEGSAVLQVDLSGRDRVRVSVNLIDPATQTQLWSDTLEREMVDVIPLQNEIARALAESIKVAVTPDERSRLAGGQTVKPEAWKLYLLGRNEWNGRTGPALNRAAEYFRRAIDADSTFAPAYAGLADSYVLLAADFGGLAGMTRDDATRLVIDNASHALKLDPTLAEAYASMAFANRVLNWDWKVAAEQFRKALELNPSYATAHQWYGNLLSDLGREDEALDQMRRALALDPLSPIISRDVAWPLFFARRYDEAIAQLTATLSQHPGYLQAERLLARAVAMKGDAADAVRRFEMIASRDHLARSYCELAWAHALAGQRQEAERALATARTSGSKIYPYDLALVFTSLGRRDDAFGALDAAIRQRDPTMLNLKHDPRLEPLRADPRFAALLQEMRFPQ
jgi:TolB-like protein/tetratricopeptide (TPR) repeat protein